MKRLPWLNALLLAVVAALAALAWLRPEEAGVTRHPLSKQSAADARSIRIERPGAADIVIERRTGGWFVTAPLAARADESRVQRLLEILEARSEIKLAGRELERFELHRPAARLTIGGQSFSFGMVNTVTREQYVAAGDAIYAVHLRYGAALPASPADLASRQLLGPGENPVRIEIAGFAVGQRDGRWVTEQATGKWSQDDLARWIEGWRLAGAMHVEPYVGGRSGQEVAIVLKDGSRVALRVLASGPNTVLARPDEKLQYHFRIETAKRLLSPPAAGDVAPAARK